MTRHYLMPVWRLTRKGRAYPKAFMWVMSREVAAEFARQRYRGTVIK